MHVFEPRCCKVPRQHQVLGDHVDRVRDETGSKRAQVIKSGDGLRGSGNSISSPPPPRISQGMPMQAAEAGREGRDDVNRKPRGVLLGRFAAPAVEASNVLYVRYPREAGSSALETVTIMTAHDEEANHVSEHCESRCQTLTNANCIARRDSESND